MLFYPVLHPPPPLPPAPTPRPYPPPLPYPRPYIKPIISLDGKHKTCITSLLNSYVHAVAF